MGFRIRIPNTVFKKIIWQLFTGESHPSCQNHCTLICRRSGSVPDPQHCSNVCCAGVPVGVEEAAAESAAQRCAGSLPPPRAQLHHHRQQGLPIRRPRQRLRGAFGRGGKRGCGSGSDLDPDSNRVSGSGSRREKWPTKEKKNKKFHVVKCWMFSFESWRLLL